MEIDELVREYEKQRPEFEKFVDELKELLSKLLKQNGIEYHALEGRAKSIESLAAKLGGHFHTYEFLCQVPDLAGVRIIANYVDDVDKIRTVIKREFDIDEEVIKHSLPEMDSEKFGYVSIHYRLRLGTTRRGLSEYRSYGNFAAELQIRTILQHSWATVSHALQYKREGEVPKELRRRLNRVAGLLELADQEFEEIRRRSLGLVGSPILASTPLDAVSLPIALRQSAAFRVVKDLMVGNRFSFSALPGKSGNEGEFLGAVVEALERCDIKTVADLEKLLSEDYSRFFAELAEPGITWHINENLAVWLLLIAYLPNRHGLDDLVREGWPPPRATQIVMAARRAGHDRI